MKPRNLLIAAGLLAALSGVVWWSKKHPESGQTSTSTPASPKVADIAAAQVATVTLTHKDGSVVEVDHKGGKWVMTKPDGLATDQDAVTSLVSALSPVTADNVVEERAADLSKYGLDKPSLTVAVKETGGKTTTLVFGDDTPVGSMVYAHLGAEPKVYALSSTVKSSFDKSANDLRDKRLITADSNTVTSVEVTTPKGNVQFAKNNSNDWQIVKPQPSRAESFQVEDLLRKVTEAKMDLSAAPDQVKKDEAAYATGQPVGTAKITSASGTQSLEVKKVKDDYYARSSVVKGTYKVSSDLGKQIEKSADEYRNKKVFDFGFSDPTKLEIGGAVSKSLTRSGTDWKSGGQTMDAGSVQAFIDKVRDLNATKLLTSGFTSPTFTISVTSNEGKRTEKVEFAKSGDNYLARRENEPAIYQLEGKSTDEMLSAAKGIKAATSQKK